jgi:malate dehydrogenase (oxaloacetate-decarboxylating)
MEIVDSVSRSGRDLLRNRYLNKGTAFSERERTRLGLTGLLPPVVETLEVQLDRVRSEFDSKRTDLGRHVFLRQLQERNSVLFYAFVGGHLDEMLPIVYTPTVGLACQEWSRIYRQEHGLYLAWPDRHRVDESLSHAIGEDEIDIVVATDGERVLGLGDLGVGGMGIPIGKLALYTAAGGIDPARTLPVMLDSGTDNETLLSDPLYLGWRHNRVRGEEYEEFIDAFVTALRARLPQVLLQWEDFAQRNATHLLERHRMTICSFNDDIQGTAAVSTAAVLAGLQATGTPVTDLRLVIVGAGSSGTGIARQLARAMIAAGLDESAAFDRCWLVDRHGLLHEGMSDLLGIQRPFAKKLDAIGEFPRGPDGQIELVDVIEHVSPHTLIGVSGQPGLFGEDVIRAMADRVRHPIVLPLSNPTLRAEAQPVDVARWSDGRALIGTGSPFPDVVAGGRPVRVSQVNNVHVFPGVGLGALAVGATRITDSMFTAAANAVSELSPAARGGPGEALLPPIREGRSISRHVAIAVADAARKDGVATLDGAVDALVDRRCWEPVYRDSGS